VHTLVLLCIIQYGWVKGRSFGLKSDLCHLSSKFLFQLKQTKKEQVKQSSKGRCWLLCFCCVLGYMYMTCSRVWLPAVLLL